MRTLAELPHRFWPSSRLPPGAAVWKTSNLKAAAFARVYGRRVNPRLRALGFTCKGTRGRGRDGDLVTLSWFAGGKAGGSGSLAFGAHRVGMPSATGRAVGPGAVDFPDCSFYRLCRLFDDGPWGADFDLGKDEAEAEETADLLLEVIEEQGAPFLAGLRDALAAMAALRVEEFEARMPGLVDDHHVRVASRGTPFAAQRVDLAVLLARLARLDGRPDAAALWAGLGRELLAGAGLPPYPHHERSIVVEKLISGDPELAFTDADRAEHDRRLAASRA